MKVQICESKCNAGKCKNENLSKRESEMILHVLAEFLFPFFTHRVATSVRI